LQPAQFVSVAPLAGEIDRTEAEGFAVTDAAPHPAIAITAGPTAINAIRRNRALTR
jgi:hypothetical protein